MTSGGHGCAPHERQGRQSRAHHRRTAPGTLPLCAYAVSVSVLCLRLHYICNALRPDPSPLSPHQLTGTGSAVLLDGHDVALLRASVVDPKGQRMTLSSANITFKVRSTMTLQTLTPATSMLFSLSVLHARLLIIIRPLR